MPREEGPNADVRVGRGMVFVWRAWRVTVTGDSGVEIRGFVFVVELGADIVASVSKC
jgi:hypothetical protein